MQRLFREETILSGLALLFAGLAPNLFPAAQAGYADLRTLGTGVLLPSVVLLAGVVAFAAFRGHHCLVNRVLGGAAAGMTATLALEAVRITSFHLGGMPGDMPRLLGVLLTDRFMVGPSLVSDILGYAYHFWNGAAFGIVFAVLVGRKSLAWTLVYGLLVGVGFLASPAVKSMGVGFMASHMPAMIVTVIVAHIAWAAAFRAASGKWVHQTGWLLQGEEPRDAERDPSPAEMGA